MSNEATETIPPSAFDSRAAASAGGVPMVLLYSAALFLSSLILFAIQPMFTKMILPLLGGTPAIWNTAVMFFQAMLLAGYLYAHLLSRLRSLQRQTLVHVIVLTAGLLFLPVHVALRWTPAASTYPVLWLVALLTVSIGVPFFAISATAPLLQRWFSRSGHRHAADPYFLYVASNVGGLLALLAYPVVIEPLLGLTSQGRVWAGGYALLTLTVAFCAPGLWALRRRGAGILPALRGRDALDTPQEAETRAAANPDPAATEQAADAPLAHRITWSDRTQWLVLAFVPSALLLAVTLHLSTDVASVPFLWVAPLSLYLLSFIFVFARRPLLRHNWMLNAQVALYPLLALAFTERELVRVLPLHLAALFVTAMVCHGEMVRRRPAVEHLTEFYLWMSAGGLLGGVFCTLIAPVVFHSVIEYPLILVLACLVRPSSGRGWRRGVLDVALPVVVVLAYLSALWWLDIWALGWAGLVAGYLVLVLAFYSFRNRPLRFALAFTPLLFNSIMQDQIERGHKEKPLLRTRSFFGVYTVTTDQSGYWHWLYHGTTLHGDQFRLDDMQGTPTTYYNLEGPLGQVFETLGARALLGAGFKPLKNVGVVGLGTGTTACYQQAGRHMTFFEVDPAMERIARDPNLFSYLELAGPEVKVIIGDGRQSLSREPDGTFDLLVLDAFSSDAIPVHMLTREALALYLRKLAPGGIVMLHISNRFLRLEPVAANLVADAGVAGRLQTYEPDPNDTTSIASSSSWVAVARTPADLEFLEGDDRWVDLEPEPAVGVWTDDYSNIFRILIWGDLFER
jgi:SAM-dependent methyltransferase